MSARHTKPVSANINVRYHELVAGRSAEILASRDAARAASAASDVSEVSGVPRRPGGTEVSAGDRGNVVAVGSRAARP